MKRMQLKSNSTPNEATRLLQPLLAQELNRREREKILIDWELAMRFPWYFMTKYAYTFDPHSKKGKGGVDLFPDRPYLRYVTDVWEKERLLLVSKSRQMLITWLFIGLYTWDSMAHAGRYTFFQSEKEAKAGFTTPLSLCARSKFIYDHLPETIKLLYPVYTKNRPPLIRFEKQNSIIQGVSQDSEDPRQYSASGFLADEMAFQVRAEKAMTAAMPLLSDMGRFTGVSSANGKGFFYRVVYDLVENAGSVSS